MLSCDWDVYALMSLSLNSPFSQFNIQRKSLSKHDDQCLLPNTLCNPNHLVDDDMREEFPSPFCTDYFVIVGLCSHIDDLESKNGLFVVFFFALIYVQSSTVFNESLKIDWFRVLVTRLIQHPDYNAPNVLLKKVYSLDCDRYQIQMGLRKFESLCVIDDDLGAGATFLGKGYSSKRGLNMEQVKTLDSNFEMGNKLEPERKM
ncbi:hypothetical protein L1987_62533 [Smallanthus sonchifolius]|uniref:Uncharacterized protein n=1 Tax=Smallanthus sonchifolius TaxID=185202 RepID=A0ACB9CAW8_9ASTR|nr:hypothetical protein L1987_62533 [Smallanthus sonchifolius]